MVSAFGQTVSRGLRSNGPPDLRLDTLFMTGYISAVKRDVYVWAS